MLRLVTDSLLRNLAALRPRVHRAPGDLKLNLGGGIEVAPGWVNVDGGIHAFIAGSPRPILSLVYRRTRNVSRLVPEAEYIRRLTDYQHIFCDFNRGLPFESGTVDYVFCSHVLEHFEREAARCLIRETLRVLKPGGWARICVPDLAFAVQRYHDGAKHEALSYFFTGETSPYDQHRYMYDSELLTTLLREEGFVAVAERKAREGAVPDLDVLDDRREGTLYVEGSKPGRD